MAKPGTSMVSVSYRNGFAGMSSFAVTHVYERGNSYWLYDMDYQPEMDQERPPGLVAVIPIDAVSTIYASGGLIRGMPPAGQYQPRSKANKEPEAE